METIQLTKTWVIDAHHSKIQFKVKHLVISTVTGSLDEFEGEIRSHGENFEDAQIIFSAKSASVNTQNKDRDNHLRSDDFFNASEFPEIKFTSLSFNKIKGDQFKLVGLLTLRDKTKETELRVHYAGEAVDPYGKVKAAFEVSGSVNRKDFGLTWGAVTEAGSVVVGDEVKLNLDITAILN